MIILTQRLTDPNSLEIGQTEANNFTIYLSKAEISMKPYQLMVIAKKVCLPDTKSINS